MNADRLELIDKARNLYKKHKSYRKVGKILGVSRTAVWRWLKDDEPVGQQKCTSEGSGDSKAVEARGDTVKTLEQLLEASEVDPDEWDVTKWQANTWDGKWQIKAWLQKKPDFISNPIQIRDVEIPDRSPRTHVKTVLLIPDTHFGFVHDFNNHALDPIHDPNAIRCAVEVAKAVQPDQIIQLGDLLDLAPWSIKWPRPPKTLSTTQPALQAAHDFLSELRGACPDADIKVIEGNHEERIQRALVALLGEAVDLTPIGSSQAALSVPTLLSLDALGVEYLSGYPNAHLWVGDMQILHGTVVGAGGGTTASKILKSTSHSQMYGHIHRMELASRSITDRDGKRVIWAGSPGTLARTDGTVPGSNPCCDWQQGLVLLHVGEDGVVTPEMIPIRDGRVAFRGLL